MARWNHLALFPVFVGNLLKNVSEEVGWQGHRGFGANPSQCENLNAKRALNTAMRLVNVRLMRILRTGLFASRAGKDLRHSPLTRSVQDPIPNGDSRDPDTGEHQVTGL